MMGMDCHCLVAVTRQLIGVFVATSALFVGLLALPGGQGEQGSKQNEEAKTNEVKRKMFTLTAENFWRLEFPGLNRFDASGLAWNDGKLLVVDDGDPPLYEIEFTGTNVARVKQTGILT